MNVIHSTRMSGAIAGRRPGASVLVLPALLLALLVAALAPTGAAAAGIGTWTWQNPLPQGNSLRGVSFVDADHGWAVGVYGTILATADGGLTWATQDSGTQNDLRAVCFVDSTHGWAVGDYVVLATSDGGATWDELDTSTSTGFYDVVFVDADQGWVVGSSGVVLATNDGGDSWDEQDSGMTRTLRGVDFVDADHGWVVGDSGTALMTSDGGDTWSEQDFGATDCLNAVDFADSTTGWAVGYWGTIRATTDGGETWVAQTSDEVGNAEIYDVSFADARRGWAVSEDGILATADGGATWTMQDPGTSAGLSGLDSAGGTVCWAVGAAGTTLVTRDGLVWSATSSGVVSNLCDVAFVDVDRGWAVGAAGTIVATSDGGDTWVAQDSGTANTLCGVTFVDADRGWAVGAAGTIVATSDGGDTWIAQTSGTTNSLKAVTFVDADHGWVVGWYGTILATVDGGSTWTAQTSGTGNDLYGVTFTDADYGWAVGIEGTIRATVNGGTTWTGQTSSTTKDLCAVTFIDASHGWAVGNGGTILATVNGGSTWPTKTSDTSSNLYGVTFIDASHGWAVGQKGAAYATSDGGFSWTKYSHRTANTFRAIYLDSAQTGWAVGDCGTIARRTLEYPDPAVVISGDDVDWHASSVDLTVEATVDSDLTLAALEYSTDGGQTWSEIPGSGTSRTLTISAEGATDVLVRVTDSLGQKATDTATVKIDTTAPTIVVSGADDVWHSDPVELSVAAGVSEHYALSAIEYSTDDGSTWTEVPGTGLTRTLTISAEGTTDVSVRVTDSAGQTATDAATVKIDTTAPTIAVSGADDVWHSGAVTLTFTPDVGPSGVASVEYRLGSGEWQAILPVAGVYSASIATAGENVVSYRVTNGAGVVSSVGTCAVKIDTTTPTVAVSGADDAWHSSAVALTFTPDVGPSGVASVEYGLGSGEWQAILPVDGVYSASIATAGENVVSYRVTNGAGVVSSVGTCAVKIDTTTPTVAVSGADDAWHAGPVDLSVVAGVSEHYALSALEYSTDGGSTWVAVSGTGLTRTLTISAEGATNVTVRVTDSEGQADSASAAVRIDSVAPRATTKALTVRRSQARIGRRLTLRTTIADPLPTCGTADVKIMLKTRSGRTLCRVTAKGRQVNVLQTISLKLTRTLKAGTYFLFTKAVDAAGNTQTAATKAKLIVR